MNARKLTKVKAGNAASSAARNTSPQLLAKTTSTSLPFTSEDCKRVLDVLVMNQQYQIILQNRTLWELFLLGNDWLHPNINVSKWVAQLFRDRIIIFSWDNQNKMRANQDNSTANAAKDGAPEYVIPLSRDVKRSPSLRPIFNPAVVAARRNHLVMNTRETSARLYYIAMIESHIVWNDIGIARTLFNDLLNRNNTKTDALFFPLKENESNKPAEVDSTREQKQVQPAVKMDDTNLRGSKFLVEATTNTRSHFSLLSVDLWYLWIRLVSQRRKLSDNVRWIRGLPIEAHRYLWNSYICWVETTPFKVAAERFILRDFSYLTSKEQYCVLQGLLLMGVSAMMIDKRDAAYFLWCISFCLLGESHAPAPTDHDPTGLQSVKDGRAEVSSKGSRFNLLKKKKSKSKQRNSPKWLASFTNDEAKQCAILLQTEFEKVNINALNLSSTILFRMFKPILQNPILINIFVNNKETSKGNLLSLISHFAFLSPELLDTAALHVVRTTAPGKRTDANLEAYVLAKQDDRSASRELITPNSSGSLTNRGKGHSPRVFEMTTLKEPKVEYPSTDLLQRKCRDHSKWRKAFSKQFFVAGANLPETLATLIQFVIMFDYDYIQYKWIHRHQLAEFLNFKDYLRQRGGLPSRLWRRFTHRRYYLGHYKRYVKRIVQLQKKVIKATDHLLTKRKRRRNNTASIDSEFTAFGNLASVRESIDILAYLSLPYSYGMNQLRLYDEYKHGFERFKVEKLFGENHALQNAYTMESIISISPPALTHLQMHLENSIILGLSTHYSDAFLNRFIERLALVQYISGDAAKCLSLLQQRHFKRNSTFRSVTNPIIRGDTPVEDQLQTDTASSADAGEEDIEQTYEEEQRGRFSEFFLAHLKQKLLFEIMEKPYATMGECIRFLYFLYMRIVKKQTKAVGSVDIAATPEFPIKEDAYDPAGTPCELLSDYTRSEAPIQSNMKTQTSLEFSYQTNSNAFPTPVYNPHCARSLLTFGASQLFLACMTKMNERNPAVYIDKSISAWDDIGKANTKIGLFQLNYVDLVNSAFHCFYQSIKLDKLNFKGWFYAALAAYYGCDMYLACKLSEKSLQLYRGSCVAWLLRAISISSRCPVSPPVPRLIGNESNQIGINAEKYMAATFEFQNTSTESNIADSLHLPNLLESAKNACKSIPFPAEPVFPQHFSRDLNDVNSRMSNFVGGNLMECSQVLDMGINEIPDSTYLLTARVILQVRASPLFCDELLVEKKTNVYDSRDSFPYYNGMEARRNKKAENTKDGQDNWKTVESLFPSYKTVGCKVADAGLERRKLCAECNDGSNVLTESCNTCRLQEKCLLFEDMALKRGYRNELKDLKLNFTLENLKMQGTTNFPCVVPVLLELSSSLSTFDANLKSLAPEIYFANSPGMLWTEVPKIVNVNHFCRFHGGAVCAGHRQSNDLDASYYFAEDAQVIAPNLSIIAEELFGWLCLSEALCQLNEIAAATKSIRYASNYMVAYLKTQQLVSNTPERTVHVSAGSVDPVSKGSYSESLQVDVKAEFDYVSAYVESFILCDSILNLPEQNVAEAYREEKFNEAVNACLEKVSFAARQAPFFKKPQVLEARLFCAGGRHTEAISILNTLINEKLFSDSCFDICIDAKCLYIYGKCLRHKGELHKALLAFDQAWKLYLFAPLLKIDLCPLVEL